MSFSKLTTADETQILALAGQGKSTRQIAAALGNVSHVAVAGYLQRSRTARADSSKVVIREHIATSLTADLDGLEVERVRLCEIAVLYGATVANPKREAGEDEYVFDQRHRRACKIYFDAVAALAKLSDLKLHYSGAGEPDTAPDPAVAAERVLARIMGDVAELDADEPEEQAAPVLQ